MPVEPESSVLTGIAAAVGAGAPIIGGWYVARRTAAAKARRESGDIDTTEASELWKVLTEELKAVRAEVERLKVREDDCRRDNAALSQRVWELERTARESTA